MKNIIQIFCLYIILISFIFQLNAQNIDIDRIQNVLKFGNSPGELGQGKQFSFGLPLIFTPDDIEIDLMNNFYICDKFSKKIFKYDSSLKFINEINIPEEKRSWNKGNRSNNKINNELYFEIDMEVDTETNLFVLVKRRSFFERLLKFDKYGKFLKEFEIQELLTNRRIDGFRIASDKIYIYTLNEFNLHLNDIKDNVFVIDTNGEFLDRCDIYVVDYYGKVYKNKDNKIMTVYLPSVDHKVKRTNELKLDREFVYNTIDTLTLKFIDFDYKNNLYFLSSYPFSIKVIDSNGITIKDLNWEKSFQKYLIEKYAIVIPNVRQFIIAPNGDIYTYGFRTKNESRDLFIKYSYDDIELVLLRISI